MANYIEVKNKSNVVQLNDLYHNFSFVDKYELTGYTEPVKKSKYYRILYPNAELPGVIFFRNESSNTLKLCTAISTISGTGNGKWRRLLFVQSSTGEEPTGLVVYRYGIKEAKEPKVGLEIFNSDKTRIFSSEMNYLKILGTMVPNEDNEYKPYSPSKKVAVHIPATTTCTGGDEVTYYVKGNIVVLSPFTRNISVEFETLQSFWAEGEFFNADDEWRARNEQLLLADVTGL